MTDINTDICVIGAGSGGLSVAAGAAQMGARVVLLEGYKMGGDCLNFGCVPSKALIAAGHAAHSARRAGRFGIKPMTPEIDMASVREHVQTVISGIAPHDSPERFESLGVKVIQEWGEFVSPHDVRAGENLIRARYFVIATGSSAVIPPVPGLENCSYYTNETIFDLDEKIDHLLVIGGGPIGIELAQAYRRLGSDVSVLEMSNILGKDDPEAVDVVRQRLLAEGVRLYEKARLSEIERQAGEIVAHVEKENEILKIRGSHVLLAGGRRPNLDRLKPEKAGIDYGPAGIHVDSRLRSSNKKIFAIGDARGGMQFTHLAGYDAGIVIRNMLFKLPAKADYNTAPRVTYTDPEIAHAGMSERMAVERFGPGNFEILRWSLAENDRARTERQTDGFIKVITDKKGRVKGATIVGLCAGELIAPWVMALATKQKISTMAGLVFPYPTLGEISGQAAKSYYTPRIFNEKIRRIVRFLMKF